MLPVIKPLNLEQEGAFRLPNTVVFRLCPGNLVGGGESQAGGGIVMQLSFY